MNTYESPISYGSSWNGYKSNRTKEIIRDNEEKTFIGKPHIILNLIDSAIGDMTNEFYSTNKIAKPKEELFKTLSDNEFADFSTEVNQMLSDPSYQFAIIEMVAEGIDSFWKYKKLGGTWIETKAEAMKTLDGHIEEALGRLQIEVAVYYSINAFGSYIRTSPQTIGKITGEQIKTCSEYKNLLESSRPYVTKRIEADLKPLIDSDETKIENDIYMLNILLKKYPNYKELLDSIKQ